jgi:hypothetical protein
MAAPFSSRLSRHNETRCNPGIDRSDRVADARACRSRRACGLHGVGPAGAHRGASIRTQRLPSRRPVPSEWRWSASIGDYHPWWMLERDHGRTRAAAAHRGGAGEPRDRGVEHRLSARERVGRRLSRHIPGCRRGNRPAAVRCSSLWPGSLAHCPGRALRRRASRTLGCGAGPVTCKQSHLSC